MLVSDWSSDVCSSDLGSSDDWGLVHRRHGDSDRASEVGRAADRADGIGEARLTAEMRSGGQLELDLVVGLVGRGAVVKIGRESCREGGSVGMDVGSV